MKSFGQSSIPFARRSGSVAWVLPAVLTIFTWNPCNTLAALPEIKPGASGKALSFAGYSRVLVKDLADRVTEKYIYDTIDRREKKRADMRKAVTSVADLFADELRKTGAFKEVVRSGTAGSDTLVVSGALWRYDEGNWDTRRLTQARAGQAQFEARLELRDGANDELLATMIVDERGAGFERAPRPFESLQRISLDAARRTADALARVEARGSGRCTALNGLRPDHSHFSHSP